MRLLLAIFLSSQLSAGVYYVATDGSDGNAGTIGEPWASIGYGMSNITGGDTLYIRGGNYSSPYIRSPGGFKSGPAENQRTVVASYPGERAVFQTTTTNASPFNGMVWSDWTHVVSNMTFDGITLDRSNGSVDYVSHFNMIGVNVTLTNMHFINSPNGNGISFYGSFEEQWSSNTLTTSCLFSNWNTANDRGAPWYSINIRDSVIEDSLWIKGTYSAIQFAADNYPTTAAFGLVFRGNVFLPQDGRHWSQGIFANGATTNTLIYNNVISDLRHRLDAPMQSIGIHVRGKTNYVYNNTVYMNRSDRVSYGVKTFLDEYSGCEYTWIFNNIFYGDFGTGGPVRVSADTDYTWIYNNIGGTQANTLSGSNITQSGNLWQTTDPLFVSAPLNLRVPAWSPAIGAGLDLSSVFTTDIDGVTRVAWDMGAYEYLAPVVTGTRTTLRGRANIGGRWE